MDVEFSEKLSTLQKQCEKVEVNYYTIKTKSKQLYEDFKKSLKETDDAAKELAEKSDKIKTLEREVSLLQDELIAHKEKVSMLKKSELELSYYKSSFKSVNSTDLNNEMWANKHKQEQHPLGAESEIGRSSLEPEEGSRQVQGR